MTVSAQFFIVFKTDEQPLNIREIKIFDDTNTNIALNTVAYLSDCILTSNSQGTNYAADQVIDDIISPDLFCHTKRDAGITKNHYVIINLGSEKNISKIEIYNRFQGLQSRIYNATMALLSSTFIDVLNNFNVSLNGHQNNLRTGTEYVSLAEISNHSVYTTIYDETNQIGDGTTNNYNISPPPPPTLNTFTIDPSNITVENSPAIINMTFSDNNITLTDISNSLTVDPSSAGIITNILGSGTDWSANFIPNYNLDLSDCSLNFINTNINQTKNFNVETLQQVQSVILTPINIITDLSSNLEVVLRVPTGDIAPTILIDPSYIADLDGNMTSSDGGLTWNGTINRTLGMNLLDNTLTITSDTISNNLVFDVIENSDIIDKKWSLSNSDIVNKGFTNILQMSPNGLLMGFIDGSNVEIYRKSDTSYTWNRDVSYNGNTFALTNNHIVLANNEYLQIYDYSGTSWNIMNGGNIAYLNIIALSINLDGTYVAVSNNTDVKVLQNISDNWTHINSYNNGTVIGLSLSPNGLKLGMGIGTVGQDFSSIMVEDVVNNYPPVITLLGDAVVNHEVNTTYNDAGATAFDNIDGDITGNIIISNNVDTTILGTYTVTYDVSNSNNISAIQKIRTVNIVDTTNPVLTLATDEITIDMGSVYDYTSAGASATDNSGLTPTITYDESNLDVTTEGTYTVTFTATDSYGNVHSVNQIVNVSLPGPTLVYQNVSTDIIALADMYNNIDTEANKAVWEYTASGMSDYLNGNYYFGVGGSFDKYNKKPRNMISGNTDLWAGTRGLNSTVGYTQLYGGMSIRQGTQSTYDQGNPSKYRGAVFQDYPYTKTENVYFRHTIEGTHYDGDFVEFRFPFLVDINSIFWNSVNANIMPTKLYILGTEDSGTSYELVGTYNLSQTSGGLSQVTQSVTASKYYNGFKFIVNEMGSNAPMVKISDIRIYASGLYRV